MFTASVVQCEKGVIAFSVEGLVMGSIIGQVNPQISNLVTTCIFKFSYVFFRKRINISVTIVSQTSVLLYMVILMFINDF